MDPNTLIFTVIGVYCIILIAVGYVFSKFSKSEDDYISSSGLASWWMVGVSSFMSGFSTWTFTGAAGAAFEAGWSVMWIFGANVAGFLVAFAFFAPWFRQMRIVAFPQVLVKRYGNHVGQFYTWVFLPTAPIYPAIGLLSLGIFVSTLFGIDMEMTIIVLGGVVVVYSILGGMWANMATDFLQGVILIPFTLVIAVLCLNQIGGLDGMFNEIEAQGLQEEFSLIKEGGEYPDNKYTWFWAIACFLNVVKGYISLGNASKYRAVKDGRAARKAALLAAGLYALGIFIWFIPPVVAKLLYAEDVLGMPLNNPTETAYAVATMKVIPTALIGILVVAMLSATMSSLDGTIGGVTGGLIKVAYPGACKLFNITPCTDSKKLLFATRVLVCIYGILIIALAIKFHRDGRGVFDLALSLMAFLTASGIPILWGMFVRKVPEWSPYATIILGMIPACMGLYSEELFGEAWNFQTKFFVNLISASAIYMSTTLFWSKTSVEYRKRVDAFFKEMHTPVDVAKEVGDTVASDISQLRIVGVFSIIIGLFIALLAALPQTFAERWIILALAGMILFVGIIFYALGTRNYNKLKALAKQDARL